jgi:hypothetical protein
MQMNTLLVSILLTITGWCCKSTAVQNQPATPLTGKLVISEICNHYVVALVSGKLDRAVLTSKFHDEKRKSDYSNVFTLESRCSFAKAGISEGDIFTFELAPADYKEDCMVCMAYYPTPPTRLSIINVKKINP